MDSELLRHLTDDERKWLTRSEAGVVVNRVIPLQLLERLAAARARCESEYARGVEDAARVANDARCAAANAPCADIADDIRALATKEGQ